MKPDLNPSDLAGLEHNAYGQRTPERRLAPLEEPEEDEPAAWERAVAVYGPPVGVLAMVALCAWLWWPK